MLIIYRNEIIAPEIKKKLHEFSNDLSDLNVKSKGIGTMKATHTARIRFVDWLPCCSFYTAHTNTQARNRNHSYLAVVDCLLPFFHSLVQFWNRDTVCHSYHFLNKKRKDQVFFTLLTFDWERERKDVNPYKSEINGAWWSKNNRQATKGMNTEQESLKLIFCHRCRFCERTYIVYTACWIWASVFNHFHRFARSPGQIFAHRVSN